eukprot:comp21258_c0_seq1/m.45453 comp21258_c0_seq1/g.45453  ORF comp21258_c0_seq1/g.45453 comp21258_c0_seq1/m.45453 type:complete len:407 (+) comp21258_c0_seq1:883-2103(+)
MALAFVNKVHFSAQLALPHDILPRHVVALHKHILHHLQLTRQRHGIVDLSLRDLDKRRKHALVERLRPMLGHPCMLLDVMQRRPGLWVLGQQPLQQINKQLRQMRGILLRLRADILKHLDRIRPFERRVTRHKLIQTHTQRPDVRHLAVERPSNALGRHKRRRARNLHRRVVAIIARNQTHTKVSNLDPVVARHKQILRLQIMMDNVLGMQVLEPKHHIAKVAACLVERKLHSLLAVVLTQHAAAFNILQHHVQLLALRIVKHLNQLHRVRVIQLLHNRNLAHDLCKVLAALFARRTKLLLSQQRPLDNLDRIRPTRLSVNAKLHLPKAPAPKRLDHHILVDLDFFGVVLIVADLLFNSVCFCDSMRTRRTVHFSNMFFFSLFSRQKNFTKFSLAISFFGFLLPFR